MVRRASVMIPVAAALLLYAVTLTFGRTFDDRYHIPDDGDAASGTWAGIWKSPYWDAAVGGGLYRPVTTTTYRLETALGVPLGVRHGVNVALYGAATGLLVIAAGRFGLGALPSAGLGLLFAFHPSHVESVAGLVGRAELLAACFLLAALALHDRFLLRPPVPTGHGRAGSAGTFATVAALSFLAAGSKESAWLLPLYALPLHALRGRSLRHGVPAWAGYLVGIGGHLALRREALGGLLNAPGVVIDPSDNPLVRLDGLDRLLAGVRVLGLNLSHLVLPWRMSPDYSGGHVDPTGPWSDPRLWGGVLLLVGSAAAVLWGFRGRSRPRGRSLLVGGAWLLVTALFFMNLFLDLGTILADRLLFWPTMAWSFLVAGLLFPVAREISSGEGRPGRPVRPGLFGLGVAAAALLALFYVVSAVRYLPAWRNDATLFEAALRVSPESSRVWYNHARAMHEQGRLEEALAAYRRARSLAPEDYQSWAQEGAVLLALERPGEAREPVEQALRLHPGDPVSRVNQGVLWLASGEAERAERRFRDLLLEDPDRLEARMNLALALGRLGRAAEAEAAWREYLLRSPGDPEALNNLAWLLATELQRPQEAEALARQAVRLDPGNPNLLDTLAEALLAQGRGREAEDAARQALALAPSPELEASLVRFLVAGESGRPKAVAADSAGASAP